MDGMRAPPPAPWWDERGQLLSELHTAGWVPDETVPNSAGVRVRFRAVAVTGAQGAPPDRYAVGEIEVDAYRALLFALGRES